MSRKNWRRVVLLAVTLVALQVVYVTPARASAELRAVRCCASHCQHARSTSGAARCCRIERTVGEGATLLPAKGVHLQGSPGVVRAPAGADRAAPGEHALGLAVGGTPRAVPVLLLTRTLRL